MFPLWDFKAGVEHGTCTADTLLHVEEPKNVLEQDLCTQSFSRFLSLTSNSCVN